MSQELLVKPPIEKAIAQPLGTKADETETSAAFDFEYRPIPSPRVLTVKARIQTISVGKPMQYEFTGRNGRQ